LIEIQRKFGISLLLGYSESGMRTVWYAPCILSYGVT